MEPITLAEEQFKSLPLNTKEAISRIPWKERLKKIATRNNLNAEQSDALEIETVLVLYSLEPSADYLNNLIGALEVDESIIKNISEQVSEEIFSEIQKQFEMIEAISKKDTPKAENLVFKQIPEKIMEKPQPIIETPNLESLPPTKTAELEIPPQMSVVPEGKVMDHNPPVAPMQPKISSPVAPIVETPKVQPSTVANEPPKPNAPFIPQPTSYDKNKDPYREPIE